MFKRLPFICASIYISIALMACQPEAETLTPQSAPETPPQQVQQVQHTETVKVVEQQQTVNLNVSKDFLDKVEARDRQAADLRQPGTTATNDKEKREIKLGGGVLVDKDEENLTKKIDGAEINLTVPFE